MKFAFAVLAVLAMACLAIPAVSAEHTLTKLRDLHQPEIGAVTVLKTGGWGPGNVTQHSGYVTINNGRDNLFFWLFESRNASSNKMISWFTGGPGCSSELAVAVENGPFTVNKKTGEVTVNEYSWNNNAVLLYIDQPVGTGYSWTSDSSTLCTDEACVSNDMWSVYQGLFKEFPQYAQLELFVIGESYAGHYVPAITNKIVAQNKAGAGQHINLKGAAIGNGLVNPYVQYNDYVPYSYDNKLITEEQATSLNKTVKWCRSLIKSSPGLALYVCNSILSGIQQDGGNFNVYNIDLPCTVPGLCYDFSKITALFTSDAVKTALGVSPNAQWSTCSNAVHADMMDDWMNDLSLKLPAVMAEGIPVLVYSGELDFICNWYGGRAWTEALDWSGHDGFNAAGFRPWMVDGKLAGTIRNYDTLTFVGVNGAGHMVPMDQPANALALTEYLFSQAK